jgi:hypothetical protein
MPTLTTDAVARTERRTGGVSYAMCVEFTAPTTLTLWLSDAPRTFAGHTCLPLVLSWGTVDLAMNVLDVDGRPATVDGIALRNDKPVAGRARLSDLIWTPYNASGYTWGGARATIYQLFAGLDDADTVSHGVFYLEEPTRITVTSLSVSMSDLSLLIEDRSLVTKITRADFALAPPASVGRSIPWPIGVLREVPAIPIVDGAASHLVDGVTIDATSLVLEDATYFPTSGTGQCEDEQVTWTGKSGNTLTGLTRAANGTTASAHPDKETFFECRSGTSAYRFLVGEGLADFPIKAVMNVKINKLAPSVSTTVQLADTTLVSGKRFAVISIDVADVQLFHARPQSGTLPEATNLPLATDTTINSTGDNTWNVDMTVQLAPINVPYQVDGTVHRAVTMTYEVLGGSWAIDETSELRRLDPGGAGWVTLLSPFDFGATSPYSYEYDTGASIQSETFRLFLSGDADDYHFAWTITVYDLSGATVTLLGQAQGVSGGASTSEIVIGQVTCDVEGITDDGSGTISGTADLLLTNPVDAVTLLLLNAWPNTTAGMLGATFATTRAALAADSYAWAFMFDGGSFADWRRQFGEQSRSQLYLDGGVWQLAYLDEAPTADLMLDFARDFDPDDEAPLGLTERTEVRDALAVYSGREWAETGGALSEQYRAMTIVGDGEAPYDFPLSLVQDATTAAALGAFWLSRWERQLLTLECVTYWNALGVEVGQHVAITGHPLLEAHGGDWIVWRVVARRYLLSYRNPVKIALSLVEVPIPQTGVAVFARDEFAYLDGTAANLAILDDGTPPQISDLNGLWFSDLPSGWFTDPRYVAVWFEVRGERAYQTVAMDKGDANRARLTVTATVRCTDPATGATVPATISTRVNLSTDGATWSGWHPANRVYTFRYAKVAVRVRPAVATAHVQILALTVEATV